MFGPSRVQKEKESHLEDEEHVPLSKLDLLWAEMLAPPIYTDLAAFNKVINKQMKTIRALTSLSIQAN